MSVYLRKSGTRGLCTWYSKVMEEQVSLSLPLGPLRVCISSSFFVYFDGHHKAMFKRYIFRMFTVVKVRGHTNTLW